MWRLLAAVIVVLARLRYRHSRNSTSEVKSRPTVVPPPTTTMSLEAQPLVEIQENGRADLRRGVGAFVDLAPKVLSAFAVASVAIYFLSYLYLITYYDQFSVSVDEVGFDKVAIVSRAASWVGAILLSAVALAFSWLFLHATWNSDVSHWAPQTRRSWITAFGIAFLILVIGGATLALRSWLGLLVIPATLMLVDLSRAYSQKLPARPKAAHSHAVRLARRSAAILVVGLAAVPLLRAPQLAANQGVIDGYAALKSGPKDRHLSILEVGIGARAQLVSLRWVGTGETPLRNQTDSALYLGAANGFAVFFDFDFCKTLRLPTNAVSQEVESPIHPDGSTPHAAPAPPTCV